MSYESDLLRDWYLLFHYGAPEEILNGVGFDPSTLPPRCMDFPRTTVEAAKLTAPVGRALDLGCAVGRSTFELTRFALEVIGIDFSASFIGVAEEIRHGNKIRYRRFSEMHLADEIFVDLPGSVDPAKASFEVGDAMNLRPDLGQFDLVHAANLLCRLPSPQLFLDRLPDLVIPGGSLVIATPATWLEEHTPRENQPTGATLDFLKDHLLRTFEFVEAQELPFLIREHRRKFQLSTSQTSLWIRR